VIKNLDNVDKLDTAEVIFTDLKQGSFNLQVKFWIKIGANLAQVRSKAYLNIKERFDADKIQLVTPTSISITNGDTSLPESHQDK
jgi:small conductance mechanosensitive channel